MSLRNNDTIAHEFLRLMGKNQIKKIAQTEEAKHSVEDSLEAPVHSDASDFSLTNMSDDELSDLFVKESDQADDTEGTAIDDAIADHLSLASDTSNLNRRERDIIEGLNKISSSLSLKGEHFAADVVSVTASGILQDFKKEASKRDELYFSLTKMASSFEENGDFFASDLVKATLNKIT